MDNKSISISPKKLAQYSLEYAKLTTAGSRRNLKSYSTSDIDQYIFDPQKFLFGDEAGGAFKFRLRTKRLPEEGTSVDDLLRVQEENKKIENEIKLSNTIDNIYLKAQTQGYTKQVVIQTGFVNFSAAKVGSSSGIQQVVGDVEEVTDLPLLQFVINLDVKHEQAANVVTCEPVDGSVKILVHSFNDYIKSAEFDDLYGKVAKFESGDDNTLPMVKKSLDDLWTQFVFYINKQPGASVQNDFADYSRFRINLVARVNYFLSEDLKTLSDMDEGALDDTSLGAWASDIDMNIEERVEDDGSTEIFFPFPYDKYQLATLGIMRNKSAIVEGPPGTGKSQTIANLLVHLAASGNRVLFCSQKDQAVRGVKDKLKTLGIKFLFGYIPDRSSKLNTETDEKDSAINALQAVTQDFAPQKEFGDSERLLAEINQRRAGMANDVESERQLFPIIQQLHNLDYVRRFKDTSVTAEVVSRLNALSSEIDNKNKERNALLDRIKELGLYEQYVDAGLLKLNNQIAEFDALRSTAIETKKALRSELKNFRRSLCTMKNLSTSI